MMGRPGPHIQDKLKEHIGKLDSIKGTKIIKKMFSDLKDIKDQNMFSCFSEVEFECDSFKTLAEITIGFMPASIEVVDPSQVKINCKESTEVLSALVDRLHQYDNVAKQAQGRIYQLQREMTAATKMLEIHGLIKDGKLTEKAIKKIKKK